MESGDQDGLPRERMTTPPEPLNGVVANAASYRTAFLLVERFSGIAFAAAIEPLRMINMVAGEPLVAAVTCTPDGAAVAASNGVRTLPDHALDELPPVDAVFVCGPNPMRFPDERRLVRGLHRLAQQGVALGGIDTGSYLLARAGLLDGYRCTIHWQDLGSLNADFPRVIASERVFEIDRDRATCSGGTAAMDMMLQLVGNRLGEATLTAAAADLLVHERQRDARDRQRVPLRHRIGTRHPRLSSAVAIMEANIAEPVAIAEIARHLQLSERQLERLFAGQLGTTPSAFYLAIRLGYARQLLHGTAASVADIAWRCGFRSAAHFSRRFRAHFGIPPREDRRRVPPDPAV